VGVCIHRLHSASLRPAQRRQEQAAWLLPELGLPPQGCAFPMARAGSSANPPRKGWYVFRTATELGSFRGSVSDGSQPMLARKETILHISNFL